MVHIRALEEVAAGRAEAAEQRLWAREAAADVQVRAASVLYSSLHVFLWHVRCAVCLYIASAAMPGFCLVDARLQLLHQAALATDINALSGDRKEERFSVAQKRAEAAAAAEATARAAAEAAERRATELAAHKAVLDERQRVLEAEKQEATQQLRCGEAALAEAADLRREVRAQGLEFVSRLRMAYALSS